MRRGIKKAGRIPAGLKDPLFGVLRRDGALLLGHHRCISATIIGIIVFCCKDSIFNIT